jgi:hypothetical protein
LKHIISASRRTDIPAFYSEWFIQRIKEGEVYVKNPYGGQISRVSLKPDDMHAIVFWSKNYGPLIPRITEVENKTKNLLFHFTITGITKDIEQDTPHYENAIEDFIYLSKRYSPDHLIWRFDPVCITDKVPFDYFEEVFIKCVEKLQGFCSTCYISFVQKYRKALVNLEKYSDHTFIDVDTEAQRNYADRLSGIAKKSGIKLYVCCNDYLLSDSVQKGSCINSRELSELFSDPSISSPAAATRKECACSKSIDIGSYDTCPHGCLYCYANTDKENSKAALKNMDKSWNGLGFHVDKEDEVAEDRQSLLFS